MKKQRISKNNAAYQKFEVLLTNRAKRHRYHEFIVEGVRNINEAVKNNWEIISFIYPDEIALSHWAVHLLERCKTDVNYELTANLMAGLSGKENASELMAIVKMRDNVENGAALSPNPILALFDRPSNKGNLGTLFRSCDAFGVEKLLITGHSVDVYDPDVIAASQGSFFKVPFVRLASNAEIDGYIADLRQQYARLKVIGATEDDKTAVYNIDMATPVLLLMGNEKDGLNRHFLSICDELATIPMSGQAAASSLNVSCAATVMLYEVIRQRDYRKL